MVPYIYFKPGNFSDILTNDYYVKIIKNGCKVFTPKDYHCWTLTDVKHKYLVEGLLKAGVLEKSNNITRAHRLFLFA